MGKPVGPREDRAKITVIQTRCFLSPIVPTGDSGSKRRQAQNNSHFHSCLLSPGPTVDSETTKGEV